MTLRLAGSVLCAVIFLSACEDERGQEVSADDFGDAWPLTVDRGRVDCVDRYAAVFIHEGTSYQLDGFAASRGHDDIGPIWREDPRFPGVANISISPLLEAALALCDD